MLTVKELAYVCSIAGLLLSWTATAAVLGFVAWVAIKLMQHFGVI